jgi:hypothetical protein
LFIVTGSAAVVFSATRFFIKSQAESLLNDLTALTVGSSTESDVGQFARKHNRYLASRDSNDGFTTTTFMVSNSWLSVPRLEPAAFFRASVTVKDGLVYHIGAWLFRSMDIYPTFQGSAGIVDEYAEYAKDFPRWALRVSNTNWQALSESPVWLSRLPGPAEARI